jgi:hypothetical protein
MFVSRGIVDDPDWGRIEYRRAVDGDSGISTSVPSSQFSVLIEKPSAPYWEFWAGNIRLWDLHR